MRFDPQIEMLDISVSDSLVPERDLPEKWGTLRGGAGFDVSSAERKGKTSPLEAGRGEHSPPANPERVTSKALKRRDWVVT